MKRRVPLPYRRHKSIVCHYVREAFALWNARERQAELAVAGIGRFLRSPASRRVARVRAVDINYTAIIINLYHVGVGELGD